MRRLLVSSLTIVGVSAGLAACGGGGGSGGGSMPPAATPTPMPTPTMAPTYTMSGSVVAIAQTAFGASAVSQGPLVGATVVIGTTPVNGGTPPAVAPSGDVIVQTNSAGVYTATLTTAPIAPPSGTFVAPQNNLSGFTPPALGYFVEVFGVGADGKSASVPVPYHGFLSSNGASTVHVTTASGAEAAGLADLNSFRASKGFSALAFDELAEEAARLHATDEGTAPTYYCHYDRSNRGPQSRYLALSGLGATGENLAGAQVPFTIAQADAEFEAEGPGGGHYNNIVDPSKYWAGMAQVAGIDGNSYVDEELIVPNAYAADTYPAVTTGVVTCPAGTIANGS